MKQEQQVQPLRKGFGAPTTNQADIVITTDLDIHQAASAGELNRLKEIVKYQGRSQVFKADHHGWKPLHKAARSGHADELEYLLKEGAKVNERTNSNEGGNALYWAQKDPKENARAIAVLKKYGGVSLAPRPVFDISDSDSSDYQGDPFPSNDSKDLKPDLRGKNSQSNGVGGDFDEFNKKGDREKTIEQNSNLVYDTDVSRDNLMEVKDDSGKVYYVDTKTRKIFLDLPNTKNTNGDSSIEKVETPTKYGFVNTPRCGSTWEDANNHCYVSCQSDKDCPHREQKCFFDLANDCPSVVDLPMSGRLSFIEDIGKVKSHWNMPLDKWNFCCGEGHYCSDCYGQSCCTGEPKCCQLGDDYDAECCSKAPGRCYWNECKPCPAGAYSPVGGHYAHVPGYTCPPCPPGTTSEEGATECYPDLMEEHVEVNGNPRNVLAVVRRDNLMEVIYED